MSRVQPRVVLGVQGAQVPANALRGIGRWTAEFCTALTRTHPELVAAVSVDTKLPLPAFVAGLPDGTPVIDTATPVTAGPDERVVFHVFSALENTPIDEVWPRWAQEPEVGLVTTLYDMIPALYPDQYFTGPLKHLLRARYGMHRAAGAVLAISQTTADDGCRLLGLAPRRCAVVPGSVSAHLAPHPGGRDAAAGALEPRGIRPGFVLSIGNVDPRKNLLRLFDAYALLPATVRSRHQLVVTCSQADAHHLDRLRAAADERVIAADVVLTAFVDDDTMRLLYQACELMVFPSLYEGLGLPLIEALTCGAAAIASDVGPMREIVSDPEARFDPTDTAAISATMLRVLTESGFADRLRADAPRLARRYDWDDSARVARAAYERVAADGVHRARGRTVR